LEAETLLAVGQSIWTPAVL